MTEDFFNFFLKKKKLVAVSVQGGAQTSHPVPIFAAPQQPIKHAMLASSGVCLVSTGTLLRLY
jgi:hypothetical protein